MTKRKLIIVAGLLVLLVALLVIIVVDTGREKSSTLLEKQVPPVDKKRVAEIKQQIAWSSAQKTGDWPIYSEERFKIEYAPRAAVFFVTILKSPFEESKMAAEEWFKKYGLNSQELCEIQITFIAPREVKEAFSGLDIVPTGCPELPEPSPLMTP